MMMVWRSLSRAPKRERTNAAPQCTAARNSSGRSSPAMPRASMAYADTEAAVASACLNASTAASDGAAIVLIVSKEFSCR